MYSFYDLIIFFIILILYLALSFCVIRHSFRMEGVFSTGLLLVLLSTIYYVSIPLELIIAHGNDYYVAGVHVKISDYDKVFLIYNTLISIPAFYIGYILSGYRSDFYNIRICNGGNLFKNSSFETSIKVLLFLSSISLFFFLRSELLVSMSGYSSNYSNVYNNPLYSYTVFIFTASLSIYACFKLCLHDCKFLGISMVFFGVVFGILTSDKNPILISMLPLVAKVNMSIVHRRTGIFFLIVILPLGFIALLMLIPAFSLYRAGIDIFSFELFKYYNFSFTSIDPAGPFVSLVETLRGGESLQLGFQYVKDLLVLIPRSVFPARPFDLSEQFARGFIQNWQPGLGLGYSFMAEGFVNFGRYFCFLHFFIVGFFWGCVWRIIRLFLKNKAHTDILYRTLGLYLIVLMHRGPSLSLVKMMLHFFVPLCVLIVLVKTFRPILKTVGAPSSLFDKHA